MSVLGRLRAALGRDDSALLARAAADLRMGLSLNPPACFTPLNRAIAALEGVQPSPQAALLLGQALRAKAERTRDAVARGLRARAVAMLKAQLARTGVTEADRAALWSALARAWLPLPLHADPPDQTLRQLTRAREAQENACADAKGALALAQIDSALCQHPLCEAPRTMAVAALGHLQRARSLGLAEDDLHTADDVHDRVIALFPDLLADPRP